MKKFIFIFALGFVILFIPKHINASLGCLEYGMAYEDLNGYCKCYSGYVMRNHYGSLYCISEDSACKEDFGFGATSNYSGSCKCRPGYIWGKDIFGKDKCVDGNQACHDEYGYNSNYDYLSDKCECSYGYVFTTKKYQTGLECKRCSDLYGYHSNYNGLSKKCECDLGYTLDTSDQCVEKQNNVYFKLMELDITNNKAIIKSEHDSSYYSIEYGSGCYSGSFNRYLNKDIVVNLGTDFYVDRYDKIVLQDDDDTCDIRSVERVSSDFSFIKKETKINYQVSDTQCPLNSFAYNNACYCSYGYVLNINKTGCIKNIQYVLTNKVINLREKASTNSKVIGQLKKNIKYEIIDLSNKDWVKIKFGNKNGWVLKKLAIIK